MHAIMARTVPVQIYVPDDLLDEIDGQTDNRSEYFRQLAEDDLHESTEVSADD